MRPHAGLDKKSKLFMVEGTIRTIDLKMASYRGSREGRGANSALGDQRNRLR